MLRHWLKIGCGNRAPPPPVYPHPSEYDLLKSILSKQEAIMASIDDILAKQDAALAKAQANTDALTAIKTILDANTATISDLQAQLAAAGNDPVKVQQVLDNMDKILAAQDNQAAAEAALAGTPASS